MARKYDAIIIGAGMSGMAAGIRLAMFGKKTLILEKHTISGGLNSYYRRGKRDLDVGLHALTNFAKAGERKRPLTKLLKQLRIPYDEFQLSQQSYSQIQFPETTLNFTNDINLLIQEISDYFPDQVDGFLQLLNHIQEFNETSLTNQYLPAKEVVKNFITEPKLLEMIFCPLLIYGSAWENDMDFTQFVIMFKSLFLEGFARPQGGVRRIINILQNKLNETGCEVRFKTGVQKILTKENKVKGVLTESGEVIETEFVLSSAGHPETHSLLEKCPQISPRIGKLSFTESILCLNKKPKEFKQNATIIFYNNRPQYHYRKPTTLYDRESAVVCLPNNFEQDDYTEGLVRLTFMAHYEKWADMDRVTYRQKKQEVLQASINLSQKFLPGWEGHLDFSDVFTPTTITKYTSHFRGTVYGSPDKIRDGRTSTQGLFLCGTDQGFLGIVGSLLSGVSMANLHGLMGN